MTAEQEGTVPLLEQLPPGVRDRVLDAASEVSYAAGQRLFMFGQQASGCWIIRAGRVELDIPVPGRGDVVIQTVSPGDIVGWSWLIPPGRWQFGARALDPVTAVRLDTAALKAMADEDFAFGYALVLMLFRAVTHRLQATRARLLDLYGNPARAARQDR